MQQWLNGANRAKVDLWGVEVAGKRVLVAVPAEPKKKRTEKRHKFRTRFASLADLQASQYKDAFEMFLPLVRDSTGEFSQLVASMERRKPGNGYRHFDESLKAQSPLTCVAHARAHIRFRAWANENPPWAIPKSTCWQPWLVTWTIYR